MAPRSPRFLPTFRGPTLLAALAAAPVMFAGSGADAAQTPADAPAGVATSPLADADLAEVMNWMLWRFDEGHLPSAFRPFTAVEIGRLRTQPLRLEASQLRATLLRSAEQSGSP